MNTFFRLLSLSLALAVSSASCTQAQGIATPPLQVSDVPRETQADSGTGRYEPPFPAKAELPTLWLIGDSTVRNGSKGDNGPTGQWGWGAPITAYFDLSKINVVNRALGGTSSRSFYNGDLWKNIKPLIKQGDFVMLQFGANDNGGAKGKAGLSGIGDDTQMNGEETVHSFGWYLKQYVSETRNLGAIPIICSLTPRKSWTEDGKFPAGSNHAQWAEQVATETKTAFVPLNTIIAQTYEKLGKEKVDTLYVPSPTEKLHTGWDGAVINAECVVAGLKALPKDPLNGFFSTRALAIPAWKN